MSLKRKYAEIEEASTSEEETATNTVEVEPEKKKWEIDMMNIECLSVLCRERILKKWCMDNLEAFETYGEVCDAAQRIPPDARDEFKNRWAMMRAKQRVGGHLKIVHKHLVSSFFDTILKNNSKSSKEVLFFYFLTADNCIKNI